MWPHSVYYNSFLHVVCKGSARENKKDHRVYNHSENPFRLSHLCLLLLRVWSSSERGTGYWASHETQGRSVAEAGSNLKHQLVSLEDTGSLSSWEKIQFTLTQTTLAWQAPSLVFTRVPPSPTLCLTRQFCCCKLSDKPFLIFPHAPKQLQVRQAAANVLHLPSTAPRCKW